MAITIAYHSSILRSSDEIMTLLGKRKVPTHSYSDKQRVVRVPHLGIGSHAKHSGFGEMTLGQLVSKGVSIHLLQSAWTTWDVHFDAD